MASVPDSGGRAYDTISSGGNTVIDLSHTNASQPKIILLGFADGNDLADDIILV